MYHSQIPKYPINHMTDLSFHGIMVNAPLFQGQLQLVGMRTLGEDLVPSRADLTSASKGGGKHTHTHTLIREKMDNITSQAF
jgi:hypothetical protein